MGKISMLIYDTLQSLDDSQTPRMELNPLAGNKPKHLPQYLTGLAATMGALSMGAILGYSSPASIQLAGVNNTICDTNGSCQSLMNVSDCALINDNGLTDSELSWFSSSVNLGALIGAPLTGLLINNIGRRTTMILSIAPFLLGWVLIGLLHHSVIIY